MKLELIETLLDQHLHQIVQYVQVDSTAQDKPSIQLFVQVKHSVLKAQIQQLPVLLGIIVLLKQLLQLIVQLPSIAQKV